MYIIYYFKFIFFFMSAFLFDFSPESDLSNWNIVNDVVMGGRSDSDFSINAAGHGIFKGTVSLENNGGFAMVRYSFTSMQVEAYRKVVLRLRGDGKRYQLRVKTDAADQHAYIQHFQTNGEWQLIEFPLADLRPTFRGRALNLPNYPGDKMEEIAFLIGNKKAEDFQLEIDWILLE